MHVPRATREPVAPEVATLGAVAAQGALVICAGAGVSKGDPARLPLGRELAEIVHASLRDRLGADALAAADPTELLSVADTVATMPGGAALLQTALLGAAVGVNCATRGTTDLGLPPLRRTPRHRVGCLRRSR